MWLIFFTSVILAKLSFATENENWFVRIASDPIIELALHEAPEIEKDEETAKAVYVIKGSYHKSGFGLFFDGAAITIDKTGAFTIRVPVQGETTTFEIIARSAKSEITETIGIVMSKAEQEKRMKSLPIVKVESSPLSHPEEKSKWAFNEAYVAPLVAIQESATRKNYTLAFGWSPSYYFHPKGRGRLNLGAMAFDKAGGGSFFSIEAALFGEWEILPRFAIALAPGAQYWFAFAGLRWEVLGELSYTFDLPLFLFFRLTRAFLGFSYLFDNLRTKQGRLGVVVAL